MMDSDERQQLIIQAIDAKNELVKKIDRLAVEGIKQYFQQIKHLSCMQYYQQFFEEYFEAHAAEILPLKVIPLFGNLF